MNFRFSSWSQNILELWIYWPHASLSFFSLFYKKHLNLHMFGWCPSLPMGGRLIDSAHRNPLSLGTADKQISGWKSGPGLESLPVTVLTIVMFRDLYLWWFLKDYWQWRVSLMDWWGEEANILDSLVENNYSNFLFLFLSNNPSTWQTDCCLFVSSCWRWSILSRPCLGLQQLCSLVCEILFGILWRNVITVKIENNQWQFEIFCTS